MTDTRDEVLKLTKGKATRSKIGSRAVPHRLTISERKKFEVAIQRGFLISKESDRENIKNCFIDYKRAEGFDPIVIENNNDFPFEYSKTIQRIEAIDPYKYNATRNFLSGQVTRLSPYITRGVISLNQIFDLVSKKYPELDLDTQFYKELAWREYFLRVRENLGNKIFESLNDRNQNDLQNLLPTKIIHANTGIDILDKEILKLQSNGYIHNHSRMWIASLIANFANTDWRIGAKWMYYYLLDGELSSNYLSWQWVAGTFSNKQYVFNQENINTFSNTNQKNTFLDKTYEEIRLAEFKNEFEHREEFNFKNQVLQVASQDYKKDLPTMLYSPWTLDLNWEIGEKTLQKVLLLEPSHFNRFPVSGKVLGFILGLAKQIKDIKIVVKDFTDLEIPKENLYAKQHINTSHWKVENITEQEYLFPTVTDYYSSFFKYWNTVLKANKSCKSCGIFLIILFTLCQL